jgi:hypothetical protein
LKTAEKKQAAGRGQQAVMKTRHPFDRLSASREYALGTIDQRDEVF